MKILNSLILAAIFLATPAVKAQDITQSGALQTIQKTVGVVQIVRIAKESKAGKDIANQAKAMDEKFRSQLQSEEKKLKEAEEQLVRQRTVLAPEAYGKKREEFQKKIAGMQQKVRDDRRNIQQGLQKANATLQQTIGSIIKEIAMSRKLMLVLPQEQVLFYENSLNITDEVLRKLDSKLPSVKVNKN